MTKLKIKPQYVNDTMLATTAVHEMCNKICDLYEETPGDDEVVAKLRPKHKGPDKEVWNQRKSDIWREACQLDKGNRHGEPTVPR